MISCSGGSPKIVTSRPLASQNVPSTAAAQPTAGQKRVAAQAQRGGGAAAHRPADHERSPGDQQAVLDERGAEDRAGRIAGLGDALRPATAAITAYAMLARTNAASATASGLQSGTRSSHGRSCGRGGGSGRQTPSGSSGRDGSDPDWSAEGGGMLDMSDEP